MSCSAAAPTVETLARALNDLQIRFAKLERPESAELITRRWLELRELVQYLSVVGRVDVLANLLESLRSSKRETENAVTRSAPAEPADEPGVDPLADKPVDDTPVARACNPAGPAMPCSATPSYAYTE